MERQRRAAWGTVVFVALVPGTVVGLIPWWLAGRRVHPPLGGTPATRIAGAALVAAAAPLLADAFVRFARAAGTPAPVFETERLVVEGPYRWVRNPQYVGVVTTVAGEGLLYGSRSVLAWAGALWTAFHLFVRVYEEPRLRRQFGAQYDAFVGAVPRWIPRVPR